MPKLENWSITVDESDVYTAPECKKIRLQGNVYRHEFIEDGKYVSTSSIQNLDMEKKEVKTLNSTYTLGEMNPEYKKWLEETKKQ